VCVEEEDRKVLSVNKDESSKIEKGNRKLLLPVEKDETQVIQKGNRKMLLPVDENEASKKEQRDKKMVLPVDKDELSTSISRTRRMLLDIILCTLNYMCVVLKFNESSIKDENSLNLHGCEFGCYNDIERNGLIIDFNPWLEFGDFTRLRDDILLKIHSCVKKGILIFPDWVRQLKRTKKKNALENNKKKKKKKEQRQTKPN
jgi:hypothetical protein